MDKAQQERLLHRGSIMAVDVIWSYPRARATREWMWGEAEVGLESLKRPISLRTQAGARQ